MSERTPFENIHTATEISVENYSRIAHATLRSAVENTVNYIIDEYEGTPDELDAFIEEVIDNEVNCLSMKDATLFTYAYEGDVMMELVAEQGDQCYSWKQMAYHILMTEVRKEYARKKTSAIKIISTDEVPNMEVPVPRRKAKPTIYQYPTWVKEWTDGDITDDPRFKTVFTPKKNIRHGDIIYEDKSDDFSNFRVLYVVVRNNKSSITVRKCNHLGIHIPHTPSVYLLPYKPSRATTFTEPSYSKVVYE